MRKTPVLSRRDATPVGKRKPTDLQVRILPSRKLQSFWSFEMSLETRREFSKRMLGSFVAYSLIETLFQGNLLADGVRPVIHQWIVDLNALGQDLKTRKM